MTMPIGSPPGHTWCDWCRARLAWADMELTEDREGLCPACWLQWLAIVAKDED